jgi:hypothetical protein
MYVLKTLHLYDVLALGADGEEASLSADVAQISSVEGVGELHHRLVVHLAVLRDRRRVDLQDLQPARNTILVSYDGPSGKLV